MHSLLGGGVIVVVIDDAIVVVAVVVVGIHQNAEEAQVTYLVNQVEVGVELGKTLQHLLLCHRTVPHLDTRHTRHTVHTENASAIIIIIDSRPFRVPRSRACLLLVDHVFEYVAHGGQLIAVLRHELPQDGIAALPGQLQLLPPKHASATLPGRPQPAREGMEHLVADLVKEAHHDVVHLGEDTPNARLAGTRRRDHWLPHDTGSTSLRNRDNTANTTSAHGRERERTGRAERGTHTQRLQRAIIAKTRMILV